MAKRAFLCHCNRDSQFALGLAAYLKTSLDDVFYFEERQQPDDSFIATINCEIAACDVFVTVIGEVVSPWQVHEATTALNYVLSPKKEKKSFLTVRLPGPQGEPYPLPDALNHLANFVLVNAEGTDPRSIREVAIKFVNDLRLPWNAEDLPLDPHLFSYEKDVIDFYLRKSRLDRERAAEGGIVDGKLEEEIRRKILHGCPIEWPSVVKWQGSEKNLLEDIGLFRSESASVLTTSLLSRETLPALDDRAQENALLPELTFPEAGPREHLYFPREERPLTVAVLVSGGIAPGINAVIDGIVQRHWQYAEKHGYAREGLTIMGLRDGLRAFDSFNQNHFLLAARPEHYIRETTRRIETSHHVNQGGSILGTSRVDELLDPGKRQSELSKIVGILGANNVDILYVLGGDGSMKAAHAIWSMAQAVPGRDPLSVVAIPKTMDNDILWVWQSFGFLSAVEKAREVIEQLNTEVTSNPRLCIAQLFGSDSGFVVSHAVLASGTGHCDLALIPEIEFSMDSIADYLTRKIASRNQHLPYALVVLAETAIPTDAMRYVGERGAEPEIDIDLSPDEKEAIREFTALRNRRMRLQGQTNDHLRTAGLKIVRKGLEKLLPVRSVLAQNRGLTDWSKLRVFTNEPRHLLRAIPPSCSDIIIGHRLGTLAVDNAMAGYTDFMISQWLTEYVLVPLKLVVLGRKRIPQTGIFWKSVLAKTGQPADLTKK